MLGVLGAYVGFSDVRIYYFVSMVFDFDILQNYEIRIMGMTAPPKMEPV